MLTEKATEKNETVTRTEPRVDTPRVETPWLTTKEAAEYLRRSPRTLAALRLEKRGPPWHQPAGAGGNVVYHRDELDAWQREAPPPTEEENKETDTDAR